MKFSSLHRECNARMRVADSAAEDVSGRITSALPAAAAKKKNVRLEYDTGACVIRPPPGKRDQWSLIDRTPTARRFDVPPTSASRCDGQSRMPDAALGRGCAFSRPRQSPQRVTDAL